MTTSGRQVALSAAILAIAGTLLLFHSGGQAGVVGSPHDFSTTTPGPWTRDNAAYTSGGIAPSGVCSACHIPHSARYAPLWPRDLSNYDNAFLLDGSGGSSGKPNYRRQSANTCYDCHDYHQTTPERIDDLPNFSRFSGVSSGHKPQNIAFGFTTPATGRDLNSTMKEDVPAGTVSGYYENAPPFQTQPTRNYGANDAPRRPLDNTTLARSGGHYFKSADPNASAGAYKGDKLPCSDCHDPHAWNSGGSWQAFFRRNWPTGSPISTRLQSWSGRASTSMANSPTPTGATRSDLDSRKMCTACHGSADAGNPPVTYPQINDSSFPNTYTSNAQVVAAPPTVAEHFNSQSQASCVSCHNHNNIGASCSQCHGFPPSDTATLKYPAGFTRVPNPDSDADAATRDSHAMHYGAKAGETRNAAAGYVYSFDCGVCHYGSALGGDPALGHHQDNNVSVFVQGAYTKAGGTYDNTIFYNQGPGFPFPPTRTGQLDNTNVSPGGWGAGARFGGNTCQNVYCHSLGRAIGSMTLNDNNHFRRPVWDSGPIRCNGCHGPGTDNVANGGVNWGMPNYANGGTGLDNANSHPEHVVSNRIECSVCHAGTVTGTGAARAVVSTVPSLHVNRVRNVQFGGGVSGTYDNTTKTCSVAACHGPGTPQWGGTLVGCVACHLSNAPDTDFFLSGTDNLYSGTAVTNIDNTEWMWSGHGRPAAQGNYEKSGRPPANFGAAAGSGDGCYYCHDYYVEHNDPANPFRLKVQTGAAPYLASKGWNATCLVCHFHSSTPSLDQPPGYRPDNTYALVRAAATFVDNAHLGAEHLATNGGKFCWDCHDPHGDRSQTNGNNIFMIHGGSAARGGTAVAALLRQSDNVFGIRGSAGQLATNYAVFTDNASGANYVDNNETKRGVCQVCHTQPTTDHYRWNYFDGHNQSARCTSCHTHNAAFAASCSSCHGYPPPQGPFSGTTVTWASDNASRPGTVGLHDNHVGAYGLASCNTTCHLSSTHATNKTYANMGAAGNPGTGVFQFSTVPSYAVWDNGGTAGKDNVTDDKCTNVSCHNSNYGSPPNVYRSAANPSYTRYWIDNVSWDCYTCHAYDGEAPRTPPGLQVQIQTGSHAMHLGYMYSYYTCERCHGVASYTVNHKSGFVDWSFAGSPNPYTGVTPTYSGSPGGGVPPYVPTDNSASAPRAYGACTNVYCHSTVQTSPPGGAPTYRSVTWGNGPSIQCDSCHDGDGSGVDSHSTLTPLQSGTHLAHIDNASYRMPCVTCHSSSGACTPCHSMGFVTSSHADGIIQVPMGPATWRAFTLTAAATIFDRPSAQGVDNQNKVPGMAYGGCSSIPCHTDGAGGAPLVARASWGDNSARTRDCTYCHGGNRTSSSSMATGSHAAHVASFKCSVCHRATVAAGSDNAIAAYDNHLNGVKNVLAGDNNTFSYDNGTRQCSNISCHGGGQANWITDIGLFSCQNCHVRTGDVDDFGTGTAASLGGNGITAGIDNAQWLYSGHGRDSGSYDCSANTAAALLSTTPASTGINKCVFCHSRAVGHNDASNPFRLANWNWQGLDWNGNCYICHSSVSGKAAAGYAPPADNTGTYGTKTSASFVADRHYNVGSANNARHDNVTYNGGKFCWDCHDPHGDRTASGGNIFMIGSRAARRTDSVFGIPYGGNDNSGLVSPVFTSNASGADYASTDNAAPFNGICEVCHLAASGITHYTSTGKTDAHYSPKCTLCHTHDGGFRGSGGNNIEQFLDNVTNSPTINYEDRSRHPLNLSSKTYPAEIDCLTCHGATGSSGVSNECLKCHYENRAGDNTAHPNSILEWATPASPATQYAAYQSGSIKDTSQGDTWCLLCHGIAGGPQLNGRTPPNVLPGGAAWSGGGASGHGAAASLSGGSAGPPAYRCGDCHFSTAVRTSSAYSRDQTAGGFHGSVNRKLVRNDNAAAQEYPHPSSADTRYDTADERSTRMDSWCATQCHRNASNGVPRDDNVVAHTWSVKAGEARSGTLSHPTNMSAVPNAALFRSPPALPLSNYLGGGTALPGTGNEVCVTCHEPHAGGNAQADRQMLRMEWNDNGSTLCRQCHL